jgi:hypothetical protein
VGQPQAVSVPLYLAGNRALTVLKFGDQPPVPVVFDTGTEQNLIYNIYTTTMRLGPTGSTVVPDQARGTSSTVPQVMLPNARIGGVAIGDAKAAAVDYQAEDSIGVVGPNNFSGSLIYLELGKGRLRLRQEECFHNSGICPDSLSGRSSGHSNQCPWENRACPSRQWKHCAVDATAGIGGQPSATRPA